MHTADLMRTDEFVFSRGEESTDRWRATASAAQGYTELSVDGALSALCTVRATSEPLGFSADHRTCAGLSEGILARDRYRVGAPAVSGPPN